MDVVDYFGVYEDFGLFGFKILLGYCIYMNECELGVMWDIGLVVVFCLILNLFFGSGLFDKVWFEVVGIKIVIVIDVGGGINYLMLWIFDEGYKVL